MVGPRRLTLEGMKVITDVASSKLHDLISNLPSAELLRQVLGLLGDLALDSNNHETMLSWLVKIVK